MQVKLEQLTPTKVKLSISADQVISDETKQQVLSKLGKDVRVQGFRAGKAPQHLVEKQLDQSKYQAEFLEQAVNRLYIEAARQQKLRPVSQPQIAIAKFVPFTTLEFTAEVETVGAIKLIDYTKLKRQVKKVTISAAEVDEVLTNLASRGAAKKDVTRAAKLGDELTIDFVGVDAKTKAAISGADGKEYPLVLGSNSFIPGFETALIGLKAGAEKSFTVTFPADYGVKTLQSRKVIFTVTVSKVQEVAKTKLDDAFAATIGPFKTLAELKADIKKQLQAERQREALRAFDNELLEEIAQQSEVAVPQPLVDDEVERIEEEEKRNVAYRGQTWQEHLDEEGVDAEGHKDKNRPGAELRVKAGLVLAEIAEKEQITVSPDELDVRIELLKGQYPDPTMQSELDSSDSRRDIMGRMLSEKTLDKLRSYATKN